MNNRVILGVMLLFLLIACGPAGTITLPTQTSAAASTPGSKNQQFTISVEYAILGLAKTYASAGLTYAKLQDAFVIWGNLEPERGRYQWGPLDAVVLEYQRAGFSGLQMDLTALSPWASSKPPGLGNKVDTFPKDEYLGDYAAYVSAVVERYDGDGVDDMPGLLYPIHDYGIEREFTGYWPGSAEDYVRLLRIAYPAIKAADADARVLLVALLMADVFDGNPTPAEIDLRLAQTPTYMRKSVPEIRTILAACDSYDIVDFHSLANYTEIPLTAAWIRDQLRANGCGERPIWIGDAFPISALIGFGGFVPPIPFAPATLASRDQVVAALRAVADPGDPRHDSAQAWFYAETARNLVRKTIVSAGEGILGINLGNLEDWKTGVAVADKASVPMLGASMFMGLTDTTITNQRPGGTLPFNGQEWSKARKAGDPRPAYYALKMVSDKIGDFKSIEKLELQSGVWAYHFETARGPVWVLWYDDGQLHLPNQTPPSISVDLPFNFPQALLSLTPTGIGQPLPESKVQKSAGGLLGLSVDSTPIFVEIAP